MIVVRLLLRFLIVPLGGALAVFAASAVVIAAHWNRFLAIVAANPAPPDDAAFAMVMIMAPALVMTAATIGMLAPALVGIAVSEIFSIRSWVFHVLNGGMSVAVGWLAFEDLRRPYEIFNEPLIVIAAGIVAGFAYWTVAGWNAGFMTPVFPGAEQPTRR